MEKKNKKKLENRATEQKLIQAEIDRELLMEKNVAVRGSI